MNVTNKYLDVQSLIKYNDFRILWVGNVGANGKQEVTNIINLSQSINNFKKFGVEFTAVPNPFMIHCYSEITVEQLNDIINTSSTKENCTLNSGYFYWEDFSAIEIGTTDTSFTIRSYLSMVNKVIGIV